MGVKQYAAPLGVEGFITALPISWTKGEKSDSGLNLTIIARHEHGINELYVDDLNKHVPREEPYA